MAKGYLFAGAIGLAIGPAMMACLGVVVAGGRSSRMGSDKALLPYSPSLRWIDHSVALLHSLCAGGVWVGGRDYGYPFFSDFDGVQGPMACLLNLPALVQGLEVTRDEQRGVDTFIIIPLDMPDLKPSTLDEFVATLRADAQLDAIIPQTGPLPLVLRNSFRVLDKLAQWAANEKGQKDSVRSPSLHSFLSSLNVRQVDRSASELRNVNTPSEYKLWAAEAGSQAYENLL